MSLVQIRRQGAVAVLRLNDPKRRNILSPALSSALSAAVAEANDTPDVHAIVITGAAPAFCAGADLADLRAAASGDAEAVHLVYRAFMDVAESPLPTIAAINGIAVGAGMNLALACDMRVMADTASFETRFLKLGLHPGGGHGWMLLRAVGWAQASRLLLLNQTVRAAEAERIGLVQFVAPVDQLLDRAVQLASQSADLPRELIVRAKATLRHAAVNSHQAAFEHETGEQAHSLREPPFRALLERMQMSIAER